MTAQTWARWRGLTRRAVWAALAWLRSLILIALVLAPIVIAFAIGVLFAIGVRMAIAAREGFKDGQRLING